ncbi:unnamed protein product [Malus baccata var. baccata]
MPVVGLGTRNPEEALISAGASFVVKDFDDPKLWEALEENVRKAEACYVYMVVRLHEAFWGLTGFGFHRNSEVKRVARESNPMMSDPLESSRVSSQKQNREAWSGLKVDNIVLRWSRARDVVGARAGM